MGNWEFLVQSASTFHELAIPNALDLCRALNRKAFVHLLLEVSIKSRHFQVRPIEG